MAPHIQDDVPYMAGAPRTEALPPAKILPGTTLEPLGSVNSLEQLLKRASGSNGGLIFYSDEDRDSKPTTMSYRELLADARDKARLIRRRMKIESHEKVLLLHFDSHRDNILWFWAATITGHLPAISLPLVNDTTQRKKHLVHLHSMLGGPVIFTTEALSKEFLHVGLDQLDLCVVETLQRTQASNDEDMHELSSAQSQQPKAGNDVAALMLTSGSTGNVKAVPLRHQQVLASIQGKSKHHGTKPGDVFLNWVGLDHVASLTEVHLHAMSLGATQVHVPASTVLREPLQFVRLLDSHKVAYTFAPNFFLAMVRDRLAASPNLKADLSNLRALISGGESNPTETCREITQQLNRLGSKGEVIRPGFGMTETCAGSIYSLSCPSSDIAQSVEFASLGTCIPGIQMRVMSLDNPGEQAARGEAGELQVSGPAVFDGYYNNKQATKEAFTPEGWFVTGDLARIDDAGNLHLAGRARDSIIVNGVKWSAAALESALEDERISGLTSSFTVCVPTRAPGSPTESVAVVYSPTFAPNDTRARSQTAKAVGKVVSLITGRSPARVVPLPQTMLEKSSLGKISRARLRTALERGDLTSIENENDRLLEEYRQSSRRDAETPNEKIVQAALAGLLEVPAEEVDAEASIFDLGIDSMHLIRLKAVIQKKSGVQVDIPMSVLLTEPSIVAIASALDGLASQPATAYTPIVPLQPHGSGTPLFCIHPGSGDILVFIALAAHLPTRPVYALRSRGYNPGERFFHSIRETAETYAASIREIQPEGPYAVAGYSLGSTLAFEIGKVLEAQGQEVKFLASVDYPPHIAGYVQTLDWTDVLVHIAFFLELIDEKTMDEIPPLLRELGREGALAHILEIGDRERAEALAVDAERLGLIADIAENFRINVKDYEPVGNVENLDIFVADPPSYAAKNRQDWRENRLGRWVDFARKDAEFHECPGIHAKMLNREHMADFAKIFKAAMRRRGV
ncbi:nonribosomal peptide synthetase [Colletotrichum plurivorum]|uniref:Nonribosomal peptide synthetase n=1 Tax=Colletotrichum plurivorum TaxID=2175906 RepID=A0A8H6N2M1_9PEZI|nr:nonribosomal peptide synthetase [Colletotrichum plurivorum]